MRPFEAEEYHPKYHLCTSPLCVKCFIFMEPPAGLEPATC
jgi:hypothetical protein